MADITTFVSASITLQTSIAPQASFTQLFLVDHSDVPPDRRYIDTARASYSDDLTADANPYKFAQAFWSQKRTAQTLRIGRWISAATTPYFVCGTYETDYTVWASVTDGTFTVRDNAGTPNEDDLTGLNFSTATSFADVITILNTALAAIAVPNITGLDNALFSIDNVGRLILTHDPTITGASAATLTIVSEGTGTDLTTSTYMDVSNGTTVSGYDAEEPTAALTAISAINDEYYDVCIRGESAAQAQALATYIEARNKQLTLMITDANAKNPASTSDVPYILSQLGYNRTMCIYTEHTITDTGGWADAAIQGCVLPATEGTTSWSNEVVSGVFESGAYAGSPIALTTTEINALEGKNCCWIATVGNDTFMTPGLTVGGEEKRIMLGVDWLTSVLQSDYLTYMLNTPLPAFDDATLVAFENMLRARLNESVGRGIIVDTDARPVSISFPAADDFTAAQRASHTMTLSDVFSAYLNSVVNQVILTGEFRI